MRRAPCSRLTDVLANRRVGGQARTPIGAKVVKHARYVVSQMAEVALSRDLFAAILARVARLKEAPA
jgi:hypothetical protein